MAASPRTTGMTTSEMDALNARIAALERENKDLREKIQMHSSADTTVKRKGGVYFDGYKTRVDQTFSGDGELRNGNRLENKDRLPAEEGGGSHQTRRYSSVSFKDELDNDESERDGQSLNDYIEQQFGGGNDRPIEENEIIEEPRQDCSDLGARKDIDKVNSASGNRLDRSSSSKHAFRRQSIVDNQHWSSLTLSSDGNKVYNFRGNDQIHFSLGRKKRNRHTLRVDEILRFSDIDNRSKTVDNENTQGEVQRPLMTKSKTESNVMATLETSQWLPKNDRHSCPNPRDVEMLAKLNRTLSMCKMISTRAFKPDSRSIEPNQRLSFQQFFLLSLHPLTDKNKKSLEWADGGISYLDPFVSKLADCVDEYPRGLSRVNEESFAPEELSSFCCGDGVKIRLIPRFAVAGAYRLGWLGPKADQYKLLVFTDGNGMTTHGVAVTVSSQISANHLGHETFVHTLRVQRERRLEMRAATKIATWWRSAKNNDETTMISIPDKKSRHRRRRRTKDSSSSLRASATGGIKMIKEKIASKKKTFRRRTISETNYTHGSDGCPDNKNSRNNCHLYDEAENERKPVSERAKRLGKESHEHMKSITSMGDTVIIEKCYVLIGSQGSENFLQLRSLQHLVDIEREESKHNSLKQDYQNKLYRHEYLRFVQKRMCLSEDQAKLQLPKNDLDILTESMPTFEIDLPDLIGIENISIPLPLPNCSKDWGVAAIVHHLEMPDLMCVLNLLLIERSILVVGLNSDIVTSCTCALLELIRPFHWMSNFMPLIPKEMLDFVNSPVPFIIGMTMDNRACDNVVEDYRVVDAMNDGLSVINLTDGSVTLTTEAGIRSMVQHCPAPTSKLSHYKRRMKALRDEGASLESFSSFLKQGLSPNEIITLNAIRNLILQHITKFAGDVEDRWRSYGKYTDGMFDFYPSLFIEPLRQQTESKLRVQEMMSHSQLFVEFVDQRQKSSTNMDSFKRERARFIAAWVFAHWKRKTGERK